ncbi:hypothetical protein GL58_25415 [Comamonas testosteroni]|uniref:Uncharacterized protein n=1 Tax=Comamonas testosteroni TaxID=285 RepID=A0A096F1B0_COMTE|nr:hypothetical protein [Comamonas testosteroni]KGH24091.1 hypothetical protein P353_26535 [Comamonas testosteroni]KOC28555.1 hypothetical protein GL58_25415 [Comamonas testosteroni]KWT68910.1 hypothetical protein APV28_3047 [Comamonas testosteroni]
MPTILAQLIRRRIAGFALAPLAAVWLACAPAMAQVKADSAQQTDRQAQKAAAEKARQHLHQQREAERDEILSKRAVIEQQRVADEKLCYQKFAVEGCLADARRAAREKDAPLRARELEINDTERKEKAAAKLQAIEEKKAENAAVPMKSQQRDKSDKSLPQPAGSGAKPAVDEQAARAQRQTEAQQRASKQADYVRRHEQSRAQADQGRAEREAKARADHEAKLKAAAEHKARALQQAKERGQTAAPLPAPAP